MGFDLTNIIATYKVQKSERGRVSSYLVAEEEAFRACSFDSIERELGWGVTL